MAIKVALLIEGCYRRNKLDELLAKVRPRHNWHRVVRAETPKSEDSPPFERNTISIRISHINLDELTKPQKESLRLGFTAVLASILNLNIDQVEVIQAEEG